MIGTPVNLGTAAQTGSASSVTITTTGAVPAGAHVIVVWGSNGNVRGLTSITGTNGLTWQKDVSNLNNGRNVEIWSAYAPSGLASGVTIVGNFSSGNFRSGLAAMYVTGLDTTSWKDQSTSTVAGGAGSAWDTGTTGTRTVADEIDIAVAFDDNVDATTSTTTSPATEVHDFQASGRCTTSAYEIHASTGTSRIQGTFSTSASTPIAGIVTYKGAAGGGAFSLDAAPGSYALTGAATKVPADRKVDAAPGSYALSGVAAGLALERTVLASPGSYALTGAAAGLSADRLLGASPGAYALTGDAAGLALERTVLASPGAYALTGSAAGLTADRVISTAPGSYAVTGEAAALPADRVIGAAPGVYTLAGVAADLVFEAPGLFELLADPGTYAMSGSAVGALADRKVDASPGAYALTGVAAGLAADRVVVALPGSYALSGAAAALAAALAAHIGTVDQADAATASLALEDASGAVALSDASGAVTLSDRIPT